MTIFKNVAKLKGTKIYINKDFSPRVRALRKKMWDAAAPFRDIGCSTILRFDYILINKARYYWDETLNSLVKAPSFPNNSDAMPFPAASGSELRSSPGEPSPAAAPVVSG